MGLGDQELEQKLRPTLEAAEDLSIVAQCLSADQLLQHVEAGEVDALVVAWTLHRLTDALLDQLDRPGLTLVLLVADPADERWRRRTGPVLPVDAEPAEVHQAIVTARPGFPRLERKAPFDSVPLKPADRSSAGNVGGVIAVGGGAGSPGRTNVAINLAAALGAAAPTVLVELDLHAPAVAAYLNCDPSRNICTLAHAVREDPRAWGPSLADELQALGPASLHADVLCGVPKREMRSSLSPALAERLVDELVQRYRWVVLDVGAELLGIDAGPATHRAALARAQHLLLVTAADLVGLWHGRTALDQLERLLGLERRQVNLVLNRHDPRFHHARQEVEWHLGTPVAAVIPFDQVGLQRAIADQRPVVFDRASRAGRALLDLAERMNEGKLRLPSPSGATGRRGTWWRSLFRRQAPSDQTRPVLTAQRANVVAVAAQRRTRAW